MDSSSYCSNLFEYQRASTLTVPVGDLFVGGESPIRVQSMTTTNTNDTAASVEQCIKIIEAGGQLVRLTTQGRIEAENLKNIIAELRGRGYISPIVADVHYSPGAAEVAALYADKVRINPGNFTGGAKRFDATADTFSDLQWQALLREKLSPLVAICKKHETTLRIGVNHGSLSDRIMAKYGDTAQGMVMSCIEYIDALESLDFTDIVISIKASSTRIMVQTVRLLSATMRSRGRLYPLHLGVTEAGSDNEGRIKSAVGIGALLIDGIGDTIRVSLTEAPEAEIPVAQLLVDYIDTKKGHLDLPHVDAASYSPYEYRKRKTYPVGTIGGDNKAVVIADATGRKKVMRCDAEYVYTNDAVVDRGQFVSDQENIYSAHQNCMPLIKPAKLAKHEGAALVNMTIWDLTQSTIELLRKRNNIVLVCRPTTQNATVELRTFALLLDAYGIEAPLVAWLRYDAGELASFQIRAATDAGLLFIDGLFDGLMLSNYNLPQDVIAQTSADILQAAQARICKAEFISCPACGRTLYDIQVATQQIKAKFAHLKGLKIAVMGCVVNGIGEMADADYGYVGATHHKISLYRGHTLIKKAIDECQAIDELKSLIEQDGKWVEPSK